MALALILMAGTGSMVNGFSRLSDNQRQDFDPNNLLTLRVATPLSRYQTAHQRAAVYARILDEVQVLPTVKSAAAVSLLPSSGDWHNQTFSLEAPEASRQALCGRGVGQRSLLPHHGDSFA